MTQSQSESISQTPASKFPIDFDSLSKGDVITREQCEDIFSLSSTDINYSLKLLALKTAIADALDSRGYPVTIATDHGSLKILTDEEAAEYNPIIFENGLKKMMHAHRRTMLIDQSNLTEEQKQKLERRTEIQGKLLQAVVDKRKELSPQPHKRVT